MYKNGFMFTEDSRGEGLPMVVQGDLVEEALETYLFKIHDVIEPSTVGNDEETDVWKCGELSGVFVETEILIGG